MTQLTAFLLIYLVIISSIPGHLPFVSFLIQLIFLSPVTSILSASEFKFGTPKPSQKASTSSLYLPFIYLKKSNTVSSFMSELLGFRRKALIGGLVPDAYL